MQAVPIKFVVQNLTARLANDAEALGCTLELSRAARILERGSSADQQLRIYEEARASGQKRLPALQSVVDWIQRETIFSAAGTQIN
jgi:carboxylate-amine ligase